jgi:hypothetical protein
MIYEPPKIERAPDAEGVGRAWRITLTGQHVDQSACVRSYVVHAPHGNPMWPWYMIACVHLRDVQGQSRPPHRQFTEASHEYLFLAIDPKTYPNVHPDDWKGGVQWLTPVDLVHQVANLTDPQASGVLDAIVNRIVTGASPDQDWRSMWRTAIDATAEHYRAGIHQT